MIFFYFNFFKEKKRGEGNNVRKLFNYLTGAFPDFNMSKLKSGRGWPLMVRERTWEVFPAVRPKKIPDFPTQNENSIKQEGRCDLISLFSCDSKSRHLEIQFQTLAAQQILFKTLFNLGTQHLLICSSWFHFKIFHSLFFFF